MRTLVLACSLLLSVCTESVQAGEQVYELHIAAGNADESLRALARLTGHALLYRSADVGTIQTRGLSGSFTVQQALAGLFDGTDLSGGLTEGGVIAVSRSSSHTTSNRETVVTKGEKKSVIASISAFALSVFGSQ
ncbi:STN domain-containing protein, partial [Steroidobacter sp.]|uniref:STN domain-containing protein n=1 Tax=Steroidobacter sp. TaxID=1978227 RepID=UPI001A631D02